MQTQVRNERKRAQKGTKERKRPHPRKNCKHPGLQEPGQKAADVWRKDVWDLQAFSQTFLELRFSLGNEGKDGKNLNSQTWLGTPRPPPPRHPRPPEPGLGTPKLISFTRNFTAFSNGDFHARFQDKISLQRLQIRGV